MDMVFLNGEDWLEFPRPILGNIHYLGEMNGKNLKKKQQIGTLDSKWQTIVNSSAKGFILFSLGSVANTTRMPMEMQVCACFFNLNSTFLTLCEYTFLVTYVIRYAPKMVLHIIRSFLKSIWFHVSKI